MRACWYENKTDMSILISSALLLINRNDILSDIERFICYYENVRDGRFQEVICYLKNLLIEAASQMVNSVIYIYYAYVTISHDKATYDRMNVLKALERHRKMTSPLTFMAKTEHHAYDARRISESASKCVSK